MAFMLARGTRIRTMLGGTVVVERHLGGGGQGDVYVVYYNGQQKALKWYRPNAHEDPKSFMDNLKKNVINGAPTDEFLWPLDVTETQNGSFGYVMDLKPDGYFEADEFFLGNVRFPSFRQAVDACLEIVSAFRILHSAGYSYQDINGGNFFINPATGHVLICDNDNVAPNGTRTGILGTPRFMAPEVVCGLSMPNVYSDRFSMSVLIFMLLCMAHPLEGKRSLVPALGPKTQMKIYGTNPVFIMDPNDHSNEPDPKIHRALLAVWSCLPAYMRDVMMGFFSQQALKTPNRRPSESAWVSALVRFRSEIVRCECGNEVFASWGEPRFCERCGRSVVPTLWLKLGGYAIPAIKGAQIAKCQTCVCNTNEERDLVALVDPMRQDPNTLVLRNVSGSPWDAITTAGVARKVAPGGVVPLKGGIRLKINSETVHIVNLEQQGA